MKIAALGIDRSGKYLFSPREESELVKDLVSSLGGNAAALKAAAAAATSGVAFRGEVQRRVVDPADAKAAGWTFLVAASDPQRAAIVDALRPLALAREMEDPASPLLFEGSEPDEWMAWLQDHYFALQLEGRRVPAYVLIVGSPQQVPFRFQSLFDTVASVGRVDFARIEDLRTYVEKLLRIEGAAEPLASREVVMFAPDGGGDDPTALSRQYMAEPLAEHIRSERQVAVTALFGEDATKQKLVAALRGRRPALVYTASHGLGVPKESLDLQRRFNGAICCQTRPGTPLTLDALFGAEDVPAGEFLEGSVFFQFACHGYGTPAISDFAHWIQGMPPENSSADFVAALPRRLLAHPRGPIAYIGHLDIALVHGFADPQQPRILDRWHTRIAPFKRAVDELLGVMPAGFAMEDMNSKYAVCSAVLATTYDRDRQGRQTWTPQVVQRFLDTWLTRNDAQNYMVFGDPAARPRIPEA